MDAYKIAVIDGDGIGPEVTDAAITVLDAVGQRFGRKFEYTRCLMGGAAVDKTGVPLPDETVETCLKSDAVLLGAVGGPKWDKLTGRLRPEKGLLGIRKALKLFANIRPAKLYRELRKSCPLKPDAVKKGIDLIVVRELTGGIYFGERGYLNGGAAAFDTETYSVEEIERIARVAFEIAGSRRKKVTSVDKANVLETSRLWRATVEKTAKDYPAVTLEHMLVDNAAMQLIKNPSQFDVMLTSNMFGDILSDEASMLTGSIGVLPSSSVGDGKPALYEPIHGSAPDIAGMDVANPIATVLSAAMMLTGSFSLVAEANAVENAVQSVLGKGWHTADLSKSRFKLTGTQKMAELIALEVINS